MSKFMDNRKQRAIEQAKRYIHNNFGESAIVSASELPPLQLISTGFPELDAILGVGGLPRGKIVETYGPESSGKTAFALHLARLAGTALYIDADHGVSPAQVADCDSLYFLTVDCLEDAIKAIIHAAPVVDLIVIDTLSALPTAQEIQNGIGKDTDASTAKVLSAALPQLTAQLAKTGCTLLVVNQIRINPAVMFGNPEKTAGGHALRHYAALRLEIRHYEIIRESGYATGQIVRIRTIKNKYAAPLRELRMLLSFGSGFSVLPQRLL